MRSLDSRRYASGICVATAMLASCGGSQPQISGSPGAMPQSAAIARGAAHGGSNLERGRRRTALLKPIISSPRWK